MLADEESYVYLGAVHALQQLLAIPGAAVRSRHLMVLIQLFAQAPLNFHATGTTTPRKEKGTGEGENDKGDSNGNGSEVAMTVAHHIRLALAKLSGGDEAQMDLRVPLSAAQRLPLGEALVLAIRRAGEAAPHYTPLFLHALVKGAAPPVTSTDAAATTAGTTSTDAITDATTQRHELLAMAALRASCFSGTPQHMNDLACSKIRILSPGPDNNRLKKYLIEILILKPTRRYLNFNTFDP